MESQVIAYSVVFAAIFLGAFIFGGLRLISKMSINVTQQVKASEVKTVNVDNANSVNPTGVTIEGNNAVITQSSFLAPEVNLGRVKKGKK